MLGDSATHMRFLLLALMTLGMAGAFVISANQAAENDSRMPLRHSKQSEVNLNAP